MNVNLLSHTWANFDYFELRHLLGEHIERNGQYDGIAKNKLYLPSADSSCRIVLTFQDKKIIAIEPGPAFDVTQWEHVSKAIEHSILTGSIQYGREFSFSSYRVLGSWRGERSKVQILPAPDNAPQAAVEMAEHPFILEFPITVSDVWPITNHRRLREHRNLTLLLNILLVGRTSFLPRRIEHFWASIASDGNDPEIKWVQQFFFANLGQVVIEELSSPMAKPIEEIEPDYYYTSIGHDGQGLRVPTNLDESICKYIRLSSVDRTNFNRAAFWMDMAARQWNISVSASFAAQQLNP